MLLRVNQSNETDVDQVLINLGRFNSDWVKMRVDQGLTLDLVVRGGDITKRGISASTSVMAIDLPVSVYIHPLGPQRIIINFFFFFVF